MLENLQNHLQGLGMLLLLITRKICNFTVNSYKIKETRVVTYICRYSSGHLIPTIQSCQNEFRDQMPTRIPAGVGDNPCFLTVYNYDPY